MKLPDRGRVGRLDLPRVSNARYRGTHSLMPMCRVHEVAECEANRSRHQHGKHVLRRLHGESAASSDASQLDGFTAQTETLSRRGVQARWDIAVDAREAGEQ